MHSSLAVLVRQDRGSGIAPKCLATARSSDFWTRLGGLACLFIDNVDRSNAPRIDEDAVLLDVSLDDVWFDSWPGPKLPVDASRNVSQRRDRQIQQQNGTGSFRSAMTGDDDHSVHGVFALASHSGREFGNLGLPGEFEAKPSASGSI